MLQPTKDNYHFMLIYAKDPHQLLTYFKNLGEKTLVANQPKDLNRDTYLINYGGMKYPLTN